MPDLPVDTQDEVERLTRLARQAVDEGAAAAYRDRRAALLADHGYEARIREEDTGDVLVCYPSEWVDDGVIQPDMVDDTDRGVEIRLSGPGDPDAWDDVDAENRAVVERVRAEDGDVHGATARALADFMGNHYAKPIAEATPEELAEFREEYFPRNAWPTEQQRALLDDSVELTVKKAERRS
ncbi:DUF7108 family protein [Haloarcula onubensis]|uniref:RnhA operon protein n=1 Tax=Haloarcula onubensis TaxID=2950539 RepID=A0ABU2FLR2_9EURY|nr:rnhA operon protein [Halomicroarcula sp. S3CR25-11]MDS0281246.1 rnhA operon protein [Halomicroarcula sp. S3CR25-11]